MEQTRNDKTRTADDIRHKAPSDGGIGFKMPTNFPDGKTPVWPYLTPKTLTVWRVVNIGGESVIVTRNGGSYGHTHTGIPYSQADLVERILGLIWR